MRQYNIHEAKTHLSSLINGTIEPKKQRVGFLKGKISVPADFDSMGKDEIQALFEGSL
jgi:hypothetical protein